MTTPTSQPSTVEGNPDRAGAHRALGVAAAWTGIVLAAAATVLAMTVAVSRAGPRPASAEVIATFGD